MENCLTMTIVDSKSKLLPRIVTMKYPSRSSGCQQNMDQFFDLRSYDNSHSVMAIIKQITEPIHTATTKLLATATRSILPHHSPEFKVSENFSRKTNISPSLTMGHCTKISSIQQAYITLQSLLSRSYQTNFRGFQRRVTTLQMLSIT